MNNTYITWQKNTTQLVITKLAEDNDFKSIKNLRLVSKANKHAVDSGQIRCRVPFSNANVYVSLSGRNYIKLWAALNLIKVANQSVETELEYLQKQKEKLLSNRSPFNSLFSSRSRDFTSYHDNTLDRLDSVFNARIAIQSMDRLFYCVLAHWMQEASSETLEKGFQDFVFPKWRTQLSSDTRSINAHLSEKSKITQLYSIMNRMAKEIKADPQTSNIKIFIAFIFLILSILLFTLFKTR